MLAQGLAFAPRSRFESPSHSRIWWTPWSVFQDGSEGSFHASVPPPGRPFGRCAPAGGWSPRRRGAVRIKGPRLGRRHLRPFAHPPGHTGSRPRVAPRPVSQGRHLVSFSDFRLFLLSVRSAFQLSLAVLVRYRSPADV